jgi:hypothetical protein
MCDQQVVLTVSISTVETQPRVCSFNEATDINIDSPGRQADAEAGPALDNAVSPMRCETAQDLNRPCLVP